MMAWMATVAVNLEISRNVFNVFGGGVKAFLMDYM